MEVAAQEKLVPSLRFKEFDSDWNKSTLGENLTYTKGFAFKSNEYKKEGIRIVRVSDLSKSSIKSKQKKYISIKMMNLSILNIKLKQEI